MKDYSVLQPITLKKLLITLCAVAICSLTNAQTVTYSQLKNLLNTWIAAKGNPTVLNKHIKAINLKWASTLKPAIEKDSKYYVWAMKDASKEEVNLAAYIEEDDTTIKYTIRYAFRDRTVYNALSAYLYTDSYYSGRVTSFTDNSKEEKSVMAMADDKLPISKRIDFFLYDYNIKSDETGSPVFSADIYTRYIPKQ